MQNAVQFGSSSSRWGMNDWAREYCLFWSAATLSLAFSRKAWGRVARDAPNMTLPCLARSEPSPQGPKATPPPPSPCFREKSTSLECNGVHERAEYDRPLVSFPGSLTHPESERPSPRVSGAPKPDNHNARYHVEESWGMGAWCYAFMMQKNPCKIRWIRICSQYGELGLVSW